MKRSPLLGLVFLLLLASASFFGSCSTSTYTAPDGHVPVFRLSETPIHVKATVNDVTTQRGRYGHVMGSRYFVELLGDSAYVYLPYFGRMMGGVSYDGTNFDEPYTDLEVTRNKKDTKSIVRFTCRHESFSYRFTLELWDGNQMSLNIQPTTGSSCHYNGTWEEVTLMDKQGRPLPAKY